jgi:hypothetical protein
MRTDFWVRTLAAVLAVVSVVLLRLQAASSTGTVSLAVKGRSSSTPWVAAAGSFVVVAWGASTEGKTDVFVAISRDAGRTFQTPVQVNAVAGEARLGGELPPRVALPPSAGSGDPGIAVLRTARAGDGTEVKTTRSGDGGKTFDPPVALQSPGATGDRGWPALALDPQGAAHAIWLDHRGLAADRGAGPSTSLGAGHSHRQRGAAHDGVAMAQKSGLYYSATGSPSGERELAKGVCYCCKTAFAAGPGDALYAAWRHVYPGNLRDIAFTVSWDRGRSFSAPVRVREDGWAIEGCPDDGPAMAVDAKGTVHLVWPTVIGVANPEGALFYSTTRDGRTFGRSTRIPTLGSPKPSHPQIAIGRGGQLVVAWDEAIGGQRVAAVRELKAGSDRLEFGPVVRLALERPAMYPVLASTDAGMLAVWTTGGDASVVRARVVSLP